MMDGSLLAGPPTVRMVALLVSAMKKGSVRSDRDSAAHGEIRSAKIEFRGAGFASITDEPTVPIPRRVRPGIWRCWLAQSSKRRARRRKKPDRDGQWRLRRVALDGAAELLGIADFGRLRGYGKSANADVRRYHDRCSAGEDTGMAAVTAGR